MIRLRKILLKFYIMEVVGFDRFCFIGVVDREAN